MTDPGDGGRVMTDEERARAVREQLKALHAFDLVYEMMVSLISFGYQKLGLTGETAELRDLGDAHFAVEALGALLRVTDAEAGGAQTRDLHATLAQMQLGYVQALELSGGRQAAAAAEAAAAAAFAGASAAPVDVADASADGTPAGDRGAPAGDEDAPAAEGGPARDGTERPAEPVAEAAEPGQAEAGEAAEERPAAKRPAAKKTTRGTTSATRAPTAGAAGDETSTKPAAGKSHAGKLRTRKPPAGGEA